MLISRYKNCSDDVKVCLFRSFLSNMYAVHYGINLEIRCLKRLLLPIIMFLENS